MSVVVLLDQNAGWGDISGCYSTGSISSTNTGGICAPPPVLYTDPPDTERCTIRHCYSNQVTGHLTLAPSTTGDLQATTPTEGMDGLYIEDISNGSLGITNAELGESSWQPGNTNLLDSSQNPMLKTFTDYTIWYTYNANGDISGSDPLEPYKEYDSIGNTLPDVSLNLLWEHLIPYGDLSSAYLINLDLSNLDLTGANLYYADISGADLTGVDASGTDCRIIQNIKYAILTNINLNNADFTSTDLSNVDFSPVATMEGVILNTADISAADFTGVDASGADCRNIQNIKYAILTDISLNNADFTSTDLSNVDFSPVATMEDVILNTAVFKITPSIVATGEKSTFDKSVFVKFALFKLIFVKIAYFIFCIFLQSAPEASTPVKSAAEISAVFKITPSIVATGGKINIRQIRTCKVRII